MASLAEQSVELLRRAGVPLAPGLPHEQLSEIERRYDFGFSPDHREFLGLAAPTGGPWFEWARADDRLIRRVLDWPASGILFDVEHNDYWPGTWGERPRGRRAMLAGASRRLSDAPKLVPIFGHRFLPADPGMRNAPVFSVHQADVIFYGDTLLDYLAHELETGQRFPAERPHVAFWSSLAEGDPVYRQPDGVMFRNEKITGGPMLPVRRRGLFDRG